MKNAPSPGKIFEELVFVLNKIFHRKAKVKLDQKLPDKDTGRLRQIDILIEVEDGPTEFRAIIEARERSRPVGVAYVEEIRSKRESVGADKAVIVSNCGFAKTALVKAEKYGIPTFTLQEAIRSDWGSLVSNLATITYSEPKTNAEVFYLDSENKCIEPEDDVKLRMRASGILVESKEKAESYTAADLLNTISNALDLKTKMDRNPGKRFSFKQVVKIPETQIFYINNSTGGKVRVYGFGIEGEMWLDSQEIPLTHRQYKDNIGLPLAEVLSPESSNTKIPEIIVTANKDGSSEIHLKGRLDGQV